MASVARASSERPVMRLVKPSGGKNVEPTGADIQVENGNWHKLHNHISEALSQIRVSATEHVVLHFLLRQTYGYKRTEARISYSEFERFLPYSKRMIIKALSHLIECRIVNCRENGDRESHTWSFNKYHEEWRMDGKPIDFKFDMPPIGLVNESSPASERKFTRGSEGSFTSPSEQEFTTLKDIYKDNIKEGGKSPPDATLPRKPHHKLRETLQALNAELPIKDRMPYIKPIATYLGATALIEADDETPMLTEIHCLAAYCHKAGATVEHLRQWWQDWKKDYRSKGPTIDQFKKFVSEQLEKPTEVNDAPTIPVDDDLMAFLEEQECERFKST